METLADLRAYLRGLFSEELTEALLSSGGEAPLYRDVGGGAVRTARPPGPGRRP